MLRLIANNLIECLPYGSNWTSWRYTGNHRGGELVFRGAYNHRTARKFHGRINIKLVVDPKSNNYKIFFPVDRYKSVKKNEELREIISNHLENFIKSIEEM